MDYRSERAQAGLSFFLFLVLCGLLAGGIYMIDRLGLVDVRTQLNRYLADTPYVGQFLQTRPISQEAYETEQLRELREEVEQKRNELEQQRQKLAQREEELESKRRRLNQMEEGIEQREQALEQRQSRFEDAESRVQYLANLYSNMPPTASATRLESIQEDRVVISILREMENATSSIILSNMNPTRAAQLTRKMANYPGGR